MVRILQNGIYVIKTEHGVCLSMTDELRKSFSSDLAERYKGGRWITVKEGPLAGRHLFILEHKDRSSTILIGGGAAFRHKILHARPEKSSKQEETPEGATKEEVPAKAPEEPAQEEPKKKELSEEHRQEVESSIKTLTGEINARKGALFDYVKEQWGIDRELTPEEKTSIEKKTEHIENPVEKAVAQMQETKRIRDAKDAAVKEIINAAKAALIDEEPTGTGTKGIAAIVKENAEVLVGMHMAVKALEKDRKDLRKMVRVGKLNDKFKTGKDIIADYTPLTSQEIKDAISDEKALKAELDAHYKLVKVTKGIQGVDKGADTKAEEEIARNMRQGGFETFTGFMGQVTKKSILTKKVYDALGSNNAAILAKHYLKTTGADVKELTGELEKYLTAESSAVAFQANERGDHFNEMAGKVTEFGKGSNNIMTVHQALGTALKYRRKAYEAYGQAEGSLNQGAEFLYAYKGRGEDAIEFTSGSTDSLERKRKALGLKAGDVIMKRTEDGGHKMVVPPRSFEKLIHEDATFAHGHGLGMEYSPEEIKAGKHNTDDFHPTGIRDYTPVDKSGKSEKLTIPPEKQAAVRLLAQQKKIYLNWEAGTGKSYTMLIAKAHIEDTTGKPQKMIVAMPAKLLANFKDEVEKFTNYKCVLVSDQTSAKRRELYNSDPNTIVLVNKEKMNVDAAHIKEAGFNIVCADEAHKITQREGRENSRMSEGLDAIAQKADYYIAASGSPTPNSVSELYFHAHIMNPEKYNSQKEFMAQFGAAHKGVGYKQAIIDFMNQELGEQISTQKKTERSYKFNLHQHQVQLTDSQRQGYKDVSEAYRRKEIATFQRDQQLDYLLNAHDHADNNKFAKVKELIDNHIATKGADEKIIFYAKNRATVNQLNDFLAKHYPAHDHVEFTGTTKKGDLDALKQKFKHDPKTKFSIHMRAGVEGLNMQYDGNGGGATTAIAIASGEDSYAPLDQFFSRADRTGQKRDVDAHLILTDTPHDIATHLRINEKRAIGEMIKAETV